MNKILLIIIFSIFINNSILINKVDAIGSSPVEVCINKFIQNGNTYSFGIDYCNKFTKDSIKCMNFFLEKKWIVTAASSLCNGGGDGSYKCMLTYLKKLPSTPPNGAAQRCFGTKLWQK